MSETPVEYDAGHSALYAELKAAEAAAIKAGADLDKAHKDLADVVMRCSQLVVSRLNAKTPTQ